METKKKKTGLVDDESGVIKECLVACLVGLGLFFLVIVGIYAAGYRLAGLPF